MKKRKKKKEKRMCWQAGSNHRPLDQKADALSIWPRDENKNTTKTRHPIVNVMYGHDLPPWGISWELGHRE